MILEVDLQKIRKQAVCADCVGEAFLKNGIRTRGKRRKCFYCHGTDRAYSIDDLSSEVERAFDDHYQRTATEPDSFQSTMMRDKESTYNWEREGQETVYAIMDAAEISEAVAQDIQKVLEDRHADFDSAATGEETEFDAEAHYEEKSSSDSDWQAEWRNFETSLKSQARFFNESGARHLASIFQDIETMETRQKRRVVIDAGPGTALTGFFRARVLHTPDKIEEALISPDKSVGPPPSALARAGRMNAHGISVFYGAEEPPVALAEIRPPVGSWAIVARFEIIRPLRLLDLTALLDVVTQGSIFDPQFKHRLGRAKFLNSLSQRMTLPVMPDDETFEYLITQAIADFLATDSHMSIDGILYPSAQVAGSAHNVVLFHKASAVERIILPEGTKVTSHSGFGTEDGWEFDFSVLEEVPKPGATKKKQLPPGFEHLVGLQEPPPWARSPIPQRPDTLRVDLGSVQVHEIKAVEFKTDDYPVTRRRYEANDADF